MVHESPYQKAMSMTGIMAILGFVITLTGLSQLLSVGEPHWFLVVFGLVIATIGLILLRLVHKYGKDYLSTTSYISGTYYRAYNER